MLNQYLLLSAYGTLKLDFINGHVKYVVHGMPTMNRQLIWLEPQNVNHDPLRPETTCGKEG